MRVLTVLFYCLAFCAISQPLNGQQVIDTQLVRQWIDSAWDYRYDQPERSMKLAKMAIAASEGEYYFGILNGLQLIGESYFSMGKLDSAVIFYHQALDVSLREHDLQETGNNYTGLASIFAEQGARDSALHYYQLAITIFEERQDSSALCDAFLRFGNVQNSMGNHEIAIASYMKSLRICEAIKRDEYIAYNYGSIGTVHDKQGNYPKAEEYFQKALEQFRKLDDLYGLAGTYNNLGILYKNRKEFQKAIDAYTQSLFLFDSIHVERGILSSHTNLGILNVEMGFFENSLHHSGQGLELARKLQAKESIADNLNWMARAQMGLHDYNHALINATEALELGKEVKSLEKQRDANLTLSDIYNAMKVFDQSLEYFKAYTVAKDSLFNAERSKQIAELQTLYESEKKDKEIQLLSRKTEIDRIRKTRLWIAFGLSIVAGALLLYGQWVRYVRGKKILSQEKELEQQRRKTSELEKDKISRELDFKKQELAAKALQLARKNEFLQSLQDEVDQMHQHAEGEAAESARKISRHIRMDIESEQEWEQFLLSFREVHRDFLEGLQQAYPNLSKNEIRLACLMKMNLSAKELAAMLNVTPDGIKKARYRMRKTMNLDSEVDIQEYLLGFPAQRLNLFVGANSHKGG